MTEYIPTLDEVRDKYADARVGIGEWTRFDESVKQAVESAYAEFDRMMAAHDAEVAAKAVEAFADDLERRNADPSLIELEVKYAGFYSGIRGAANREIEKLRARAAEYRKAVQS